MSKRKDKRRAHTLYQTLIAQTAENPPLPLETQPTPQEVLFTVEMLTPHSGLTNGRAHELPRMKKFRFQLLHEIIVAHIEPCRVADIGGGKGLLAYLLQESGWAATVIDPIWQTLPDKYKDLRSQQRVQIAPDAKVPYITRPFAAPMTLEFDLLVAMHAHGCNIQIIDAAKKYGRSFILLPCCIIDEPLLPLPGVHWLQCLADYAHQQGFLIDPFNLNFKGQNIGLYGRLP